MMTETQVPVQEPRAQQNTAQTTQTTVKTDPGQSQGSLSWLRINFMYFRSIPGLLKLVEVLFGIICMACASPARLSGTHWFLFVVVTSFIATLIWVFIYLLSIREALKLPINWILTEFLNTAITTILYVVAFIVQLSVWSPGYPSIVRDPNLTAGAFGLFNAVAYGASTFFLYTEWKGQRVPQ